MGAPESGMEAVEQPTADTLLTAFRTIKADERLKHVNVLDYWLSIRGDKEFPPLHDLDPLEISDAGPCSILLELIGGGQDAEIRHLGDALRQDVTVERIIDAANPSILSCIAKKLPIVAISRDFLAFEDSFGSADASTRCWVTLLPLSSCGSWVDYVYAFVSVEKTGGKATKAVEPADAVEAPPEELPVEEVGQSEVPDAAPDVPETAEDLVPFVADEHEAPSEETFEPVEAAEASYEPVADEPVEALASKSGPGFGKLLDGLTNLAGFYGQGIKADPVVKVDVPAIEPAANEPAVDEPIAIEQLLELDEPAPVVEVLDLEAVAEVIEAPADQPEEEAAAEFIDPEHVQPEIPASNMEGTLQSKLAEVRAMADEARMAQLRATAALHEGLSAAYDFALDAESSADEYLRLVEEQGMKIQLRAPMAPVARLAFEGLADPSTIADLAAVLAWALKEELPRGSLAQRIEEAGGIDALLNGAPRPS